MCFCLKTPYLIMNSWPALQLQTEWSLFNTHIFSGRHITAFLHLGTLDSTSALHLGLFKTVKPPTSKKAQNYKKFGAKHTTKRSFVCSIRAERRQSLYWTLAGNTNIAQFWDKYNDVLNYNKEYIYIHIYILVFIPVPGTKLLKPWNFLSDQRGTGFFCYSL